MSRSTNDRYSDSTADAATSADADLKIRAVLDATVSWDQVTVHLPFEISHPFADELTAEFPYEDRP